MNKLDLIKQAREYKDLKDLKQRNTLLYNRCKVLGVLSNIFRVEYVPNFNIPGVILIRHRLRVKLILVEHIDCRKVVSDYIRTNTDFYWSNFIIHYMPSDIDRWILYYYLLGKMTPEFNVKTVTNTLSIDIPFYRRYVALTVTGENTKEEADNLEVYEYFKLKKDR